MCFKKKKLKNVFNACEDWCAAMNTSKEILAGLIQVIKQSQSFMARS